jgi:hypothetical protein
MPETDTPDLDPANVAATIAEATSTEEVTSQVGVLLPNVDPAIGEAVLSTLYANPDAGLGQIAVALAKGADSPELATEMIDAMIEFVLCKTIGKAVWVEETGHSVLVGIRRATHRDALNFGPNTWPLGALLTAQPTSVTLDTTEGRKRVWMASESLEGTVLRRTEAVAMINTLVESWGGRIIEDRDIADIDDTNRLEIAMSKVGKARADALNAARKPGPDLKARPGHNRVAIAEAFPGSLSVGQTLHPEGALGKVYEIEKRVDTSWVLAVAVDKGSIANTEACSWLLTTGEAPVSIEGAPLHAGFSDEAAYST